MLAPREGYFCFKILLNSSPLSWCSSRSQRLPSWQTPVFALTLLHLSSCYFSCYFPILTSHVFVRILKNLFSQCSVLGFLLCSLYNSPELSSVQSWLYLVSRNSRPLYLCLLPITWQFPDLQPPAPVIMEHNIKKFLSWHSACLVYIC